MKRFWTATLICFSASIGIQALASGFALYEGSARGNALGGLIGHGDDAAAMFYNPAGITNLEGTHFMGGATVINPFADVTTTNLYSGDTRTDEYVDNLFTPPHLYITHQLNNKMWVGFGIYTRFGLGSQFEDDWVGRYSNINAQIETVTFNAEFAYKINDKVSVAFGAGYMWFDAELTQAIDGNRFAFGEVNNPDTNAFDAVQTVTGDNLAFAWDASVHYKHSDKWSFGLTYVAEVDHDLEGVAEFDRPDATVPPTWFNNANVALDTITLPDMIMFGGAYTHSERLSLGFGWIRTSWSSIQELVFHYDPAFLIIPALVSLDEVSRDLNWEDVSRYNVGAEWQYSERITLMGGFTFDESPLPDETISYLLPANDRTLINMGISLTYHEWLLTGSYNYLTIADRDIASRQIGEGVLETEIRSGGAHLVGFSVSRRF
jgi:long-chain fatty acid transport protein